jgi:hypothetical protein
MSIFSNSSHLEWRAGLSDIIVKGTLPRTIPARFGLIWFRGFRGEDINVKAYDVRRTPSDGKSSHGLWPGVVIILIISTYIIMEILSWSELLLFNTKWVIFQLYHSRNKFHIGEKMMIMTRKFKQWLSLMVNRQQCHQYPQLGQSPLTSTHWYPLCTRPTHLAWIFTMKQQSTWRHNYACCYTLTH